MNKKLKKLKLEHRKQINHLVQIVQKTHSKNNQLLNEIQTLDKEICILKKALKQYL